MPKQITIDDWEDAFKPEINHLNDSATWAVNGENGIMFETYGAEHEYVCSKNLERKVWTWVDGDDGSYIVNGFAFANRIGHFVCSVPYKDGEWYQISMDLEPTHELDLV